MNATIPNTARQLGRIAGLTASILIVGGCTTGFNQREQIGLPGIVTSTNNMVNIDGLAAENFWTQSSKIFLEDGSSSSAAFMRGMADATNIYLYFEVADTLNEEDVVVLAFSPTGNANDFHRLDIYPCPGGDSTCPPSTVLTTSVESWTGSLSGIGAGPTPPQGIVVSANSAAGSTPRWGVEIQIPRSTAPYAFPATGFFGMFADIIKTDRTTFLATQYSWPRNTPIGTNQNNVNISLQNANLNLLRWGTATVDTSTFPTGLEITGFNNKGADPSKISWLNQPPNEFTATVANNPQGTGGNNALNVRAQFSIADWGSAPGVFTPLPSTPIPSTGQTIKANEYFPFSSGVWTLDSNEQAQWSAAGHDHACIEVKINHASGSFIRQFNMIFVDVNSPYRVEPRISTGSWRRKYKNAREVILEEQFYNTEPGLSWQSQFGGAEPAGEHRWKIRSMSEQSRRLQAVIAPDAQLTLPADRYALDARVLSRGGSLSIGVKPGSVLTLIADGEAKAGGRTVTAAGLSEAAVRQSDEAAAVQEVTTNLADGSRTVAAEQNRGNTLLGGNSFGGHSKTGDVLRGGVPFRPGELIASLDDWRTSFAIGTGTTVYVPETARTLAVRFAGNLAFDEGQFELHAIPSEPNWISLNGLPISWYERMNRPVLLPLGANLPMHIVRVTLDTGKTITIKGKQFRVGLPLPSYGEKIRSVRGSSAVFGTPVAARTTPAPAPAGPAGTE